MVVVASRLLANCLERVDDGRVAVVHRLFAVHD